jgi:TPR repeat protein
MAAAQGDASGQWLLGDAFENGNGVRQNYAEAAAWYRKAATQGQPIAQFSLGLLYVKGDGVPKDYVEAYKWWNLCTARADAKAKENLAKLEKMMTRDQIADAQKMARQFKPATPRSSSSSTSPERIAGSAAGGTGFFITEDGFLITNEHVVKEAAQVRLVTSDGLIVPGGEGGCGQ